MVRRKEVRLREAGETWYWERLAIDWAGTGKFARDSGLKRRFEGRETSTLISFCLLRVEEVITVMSTGFPTRSLENQLQVSWGQPLSCRDSRMEERHMEQWNITH